MEANLIVKPTIIPPLDEVEEWRPAPGYEDRYEVSSFGNIRHIRKQRLRKLCCDKSGYPIVSLKVNGKVHCVYLHRLVCEAFNGPPTQENNICDHIDHCVYNNYYRNLHWVDQSVNMYNKRPERSARIKENKTPIVFLSKNHQFIARYDSILDAHQKTGLSIQQIQHNIRGFRVPFKDGYFITEASYKANFDK